MILSIDDEFYHYEAENVCRLFYPYEKINVLNEMPKKLPNDEITVIAEYLPSHQSVKLLRGDNEITKLETYISPKDEVTSEYLITHLIYTALEFYTGYQPKWGMITGIHPVKIYSDLLKSEDETKADIFMLNKIHVSNEKLNMLKSLVGIQKEILNDVTKKDVCIYVSIPFCPSRCSYCSFVSVAVEKQKKLILPYIENLIKEIECTGEIIKKYGLNIKAVYIGGGTPTILDAKEIDRLLRTINNNFNICENIEYTMEAGRPDTIDMEKLLIMKEMRVNRISINPQTMNNEVLALAGRKHTASDIIDKFNIARTVGFKNINMDLIAGLDGDNITSFENSVDSVIQLEPESITIHALALKRSSFITASEDTKKYHSKRYDAEKMIEYASDKLYKSGYIPYYLYRQSRMIGNLENTGWSKSDFECLYNILTMDDSVSILSCGAGGVSKIVYPGRKKVERIYNFKYPTEYISKFNEVLDRKEILGKNYEQFC
jgi:oxygen-independent coproporphyrinogen-3 oxidase